MTRLRTSRRAIPATLPINVLMILFSIAELTLPETLSLASAITAVQCVWRDKRGARPAEVWFNVSLVIVSSAVAKWIGDQMASGPLAAFVRLVVATAILFIVHTFLGAIATVLTERRFSREIWRSHYPSPLPSYLSGAAIAAVMVAAHRSVGWQTALLVVPVVYLFYRCYGLYLARLDDEKQQVEQMTALHLRTIEALALAIEAKDHTGLGHLTRVQTYAVEIAKDLGLTPPETEALRAASLLRDIGNLAVPEHIISKPGPLTPDEFEKMKIHPLVGADLLERIRFPYPVVPIVRSHHERWDGLGYPAGLSGENIPIGARILAVVDCMNAMASARPYRAALRLDEALQRIVNESGKSFDPRVVKILKERYMELEHKAQANLKKIQTSPDRINGDSEPAAPFDATFVEVPETQIDFLHCIASARQEVQALFELAQDLGNSLSLDETLSVLAVRLKKIVPCDSMAIYILRENVLVPEYVTGEDFRLFSSLEIPSGHGLSGWVAENRKPIVNGNPTVEAGYLNDPTKVSKLRSAVAVPLEGLGGVLGVLSLYHAEKTAFTKDHLRILLAISSKVALSVENALRYRQAKDSAAIDYLTSLPNARSLFLHLDAELARARRSKGSVAVLVCDLDGFKEVNDRFGHLEGNKLLRLVARGLKDSCREYDYVARMGGDEFVLVLPGLTPDDLAARCQRFCETVLEAGRQVCGSEITSISIGQAFYPEDGADAEELLSKADSRMYQHKNEKAERAASEAQAWKTQAVEAVQ